MSKLKFCLIGNSFEKKSEEDNSISLIVEAATRAGIELSNIPKGKLVLELNNTHGLTISGNNVNINEQDLFIFRGTSDFVVMNGEEKKKTRIFDEMCLVAQHLHFKLGKPVFDKFMYSGNNTNTKIIQTYRLIEAGVPVVPTYSFMRKDMLKKSLESLVFPLFLKPADGSKGRDAYLFRSREELEKFLDEYDSPVFFPNIIQDFVENDGDFRVVVLGDKVVAAIRKVRSEDSVVANMSQGNQAYAIEPTKELTDLAIKAANATGIEFAGVDIIQDKNTGKMYVLEVNLSPQITLSTKFSQINIADEMMQYLIDKCR